MGYGFVAKMGDLASKNKAGKGVVNVGKGELLTPVKVHDMETQYLVAVTSIGRLLVLVAICWNLLKVKVIKLLIYQKLHSKLVKKKVWLLP